MQKPVGFHTIFTPAPADTVQKLTSDQTLHPKLELQIHKDPWDFMLWSSPPEPWISSGEAFGWSALVARPVNMASYKL